MSDELELCSDCGFAAMPHVFKKTKGKCPRCNPQEARDFLKRIKVSRGQE